MTGGKQQVKTGYFRSDQVLPLVIQPDRSGQDLVAWTPDHQARIETLLLQYGAILFRDFQVKDLAAFEQFSLMLGGELMAYQDRGTPRHQVQGHIYTATDYPPEHTIFLHNELSFASVWPATLFFHCRTAPQQGGETPLADVRRVFQRIPADIRQPFIHKQVMYVRNFGGGPFGMPWQTVFQTDDRETLEAYCQEAGIEVEWKAKGRLKTRQIRPAVVRHPRSHEMAWFNHATVLHVSTLEAKTREMLLKLCKEDDLPNNVYYGDGTPIPPDVLETLRAAYRQETVTFPWQAGDVLMVDNMSVAHGRLPFVGPRQVVVAMAHPMHWQEVTP